jgi:hypothetical protein
LFKVPHHLDSLLSFTDNITIVLDPCFGDKKLSLDVLSSVAKPYFESNKKQLTIEFKCYKWVYHFFVEKLVLNDFQEGNAS